MSSETESSIADIVRAIQEERQMSRADIAAELGRSPRMVTKLLNGESKGESFRDALSSLRERGTVERRPARRRNRQGEIVPVRAKIDSARAKAPKGEKEKAPTVVPEETGGRYVKKAPNRFSSKTAYAKNGNRVHDVTMNRTNKESRKRGLESVKEHLRSVTRSQSHKDKRISFTVTMDNGRVMSIGEKSGYFSSDVLNTINKKFGGDVEKFVNDQLNKVYKGKGGVPGGHKFTGIRMNVTEAKGQAQNSRKGR